MKYLRIFNKPNRKWVLALLLALLVTITLGLFIPPRVDAFNDDHFGDVTILEKPELVDALKDSQDAGVWMALHGYHHEDYRLVDAELPHWLDAILGDIDGQLPEMERHKRVISCVCPKCNPQTSDAPIESSSTMDVIVLR